MAERTSFHARDSSKEHKSDLTVEKDAPCSSKISRPRSPSSHDSFEEMSKRPAININGNSYQFNNSYVGNREINGSKLPTLHQIPCISNSLPRPQTLPIMEKANPYLSNGNFLSKISPDEFYNPYQHSQYSTPKIGITSFIQSYNWENSVPFRPSFTWPKLDSSSQSQTWPKVDSINSQSQILYDPLVHSIDPPPIPPNKKSDSESMNISPQISEEEKAQSNNISLPPLSRVNNNNELVYRGSLGAEGSNEVSSSNSLSYKPGKTDQFNNRESKELKMLKNALAAFIKELLKPAWQKGILSKDAHKRVVRKAIEKITGSMQMRQVPDSEEATKLYLSMNKPKIEKLVQEYLEIYGKSEKRDLEVEVNSVV